MLKGAKLQIAARVAAAAVLEDSPGRWTRVQGHLPVDAGDIPSSAYGTFVNAVLVVNALEAAATFGPSKSSVAIERLFRAAAADSRHDASFDALIEEYRFYIEGGRAMGPTGLKPVAIFAMLLIARVIGDFGIASSEDPGNAHHVVPIAALIKSMSWYFWRALKGQDIAALRGPV